MPRLNITYAGRLTPTKKGAIRYCVVSNDCGLIAVALMLSNFGRSPFYQHQSAVERLAFSTEPSALPSYQGLPQIHHLYQLAARTAATDSTKHSEPHIRLYIRYESTLHSS